MDGNKKSIVVLADCERKLTGSYRQKCSELQTKSNLKQCIVVGNVNSGSDQKKGSISDQNGLTVCYEKVLVKGYQEDASWYKDEEKKLIQLIENVKLQMQ